MTINNSQSYEKLGFREIRKELETEKRNETFLIIVIRWIVISEKMQNGGHNEPETSWKFEIVILNPLFKKSLILS